MQSNQVESNFSTPFGICNLQILKAYEVPKVPNAESIVRVSHRGSEIKLNY